MENGEDVLKPTAELQGITHNNLIKMAIDEDALNPSAELQGITHNQIDMEYVNTTQIADYQDGSLETDIETKVNDGVIKETESHGPEEDTCLVNTQSEQVNTKIKYVFDSLKILTGAWSEFRQKAKKEEMFLKGCKWSPDGTCLLTNSNDSIMRLFDLPLDLYNCHCLSKFDFAELQPSLRTQIGGLVYDYTWYPLMTSTDPATCCFVTTSCNTPVQMWDAYSGNLRCTYQGYNVQDEIHAALSVTFNPMGDLLLCGYKNDIKIFNTDLPGRDCFSLSTKELCDQRGIVSCIAVNPSMPNLFAAGTYSKTIGLYSTDGHAMCLLTGQRGGLTQLMFSQNGSQLYSAGRKDSEILSWDLRQLGQVLCVLQRPHSTNQRIYFDISPDSNYLMSGSSDGKVRVWDLRSVPVTPSGSHNSVLEPLTGWLAHNDCVNGLSVHRYIPVVATASGQRYIPEIKDESDDEIFTDKIICPHKKVEDSVKLWWTGPIEKM